MDPRFRVDLIAATPNPQQCVYAGMHQDYSEGFVAADRAGWPDESRAGEICVKRLLAGGSQGRDDEIDAAVRRKIGSLSRKVVPGSREWDVLYRQYAEEERRRRR